MPQERQLSFSPLRLREIQDHIARKCRGPEESEDPESVLCVMIRHLHWVPGNYSQVQGGHGGNPRTKSDIEPSLLIDPPQKTKQKHSVQNGIVHFKYDFGSYICAGLPQGCYSQN
jgi:hypothetical protein